MTLTIVIGNPACRKFWINTKKNYIYRREKSENDLYCNTWKTFEILKHERLNFEQKGVLFWSCTTCLKQCSCVMYNAVVWCRKNKIILIILQGRFFVYISTFFSLVVISILWGNRQKCIYRSGRTSFQEWCVKTN